MPQHELLGGLVQLYKRDNSRFWQCYARVGQVTHRTSTKQEGLAQATDFAEDWYLELRGKNRVGDIKSGKLFKYAADRFMAEYAVLNEGQRSPVYIENHRRRLRLYLIPFFGKYSVNEITPGLVQDYRIHRVEFDRHGEPRVKGTANGIRPSRSTIHQEIVCLRQVLKYANRQGWLTYLPDISAPYKASGKIGHRAWFSPEDYKRFYQATRERAKNPLNERWRSECENLHDFVLFMVNTGLRPDEATRLEFRDVAVVTDDATGERILEIEVRGKRGVGYCKSMPGAVFPFQRLQKRNGGTATDRLFPKIQRELINTILDELGMKLDRDGNRRTAYSLRHTYICLRLMEGADIYQIAKNCRTSVEMIEKFYASHLKNTLDASAINVRKPKRPTKRPPKEPEPTLN